MKKVAIISLDNIYATPYIYEYIRRMDDCITDVIFWNKNDVYEEDLPVNKTFQFKHKYNSKMFGYFKYMLFLNKLLKKNNYDKLILLHGPLNVMLCNILRNFEGKYILDIRDYTYEKYLLYRIIQNRNIIKSYETVISSKGYEKFLPKKNYTLMHNIFNDYRNSNFTINNFKSKKRDKYIITQVGTIRFYDEIYKILKLFNNNNEFLFKYIGKGSEKIDKSWNRNVSIEGYFDPKETLLKYKDADAINNLYGNNSMSVKYALSNKLYIAALLKIPIIVSSNTYMAEVIKRYKLGFVFDNEKKEAIEELSLYLENYDRSEFNEACMDFLNDVEKDIEEFSRLISQFIND